MFFSFEMEKSTPYAPKELEGGWSSMAARCG